MKIIKNILKSSLIFFVFIQVFLCSVHADPGETIHMVCLFIFQDGRQNAQNTMIDKRFEINMINAYSPSKSNWTYVYNGQTLCPHQTFEFYNIPDHSMIVCMPSENPDLVQKWLHLSQSRQSEFDNIAYRIIVGGDGQCLLMAHQLDAKMMKILSSNGKKYRAFMKDTGMNILYEGSTSTKTIPTIIPRRPDTISEEPLPTLW